MDKPIRPEERGWDRKKIDETVGELSQDGAHIVSSLRNFGAFDYELTFCPSQGVQVTVFVSIGDWQTDSAITITEMTTLPETVRKKGYGSQAIKRIIEWARRHNFNEIRATQVSSPDARRFWEQNGFTYVTDPNPTGDLVLQL